MTTLRPISRNAKEVQYADPDRRYNTVTIRNAVQPKKAGAVSVYNSKSGVNIQKTATLPAQAGCTDNCAPLNQEKLSGSISFSGSTASKAEIIAMWTDLKSIGDLVIADLAAGFLPSAETVITVS